jgi:hypothetical protein
MKAVESHAPANLRLSMILVVAATAVVAGRIIGVDRVVVPAQFRPDPATVAGSIVLPLAGNHPIGIAALAASREQTRRQIDADEQRGVWPARRPEPVPTLGANDRSRWLTVRALVDEGTYAIGYRDTDPQTGAYHDRGLATQSGWYTNDKVLRPDIRDNTQAFYSSKPPLLSTILAGEYWLLKKALGWSMTTHPRLVVRTILLTVNAVPFFIYLALLARLAARYGASDWGRLFVVAAAGFATFVTAFSVTLNNHTVAAWSCLFALYAALSIYDGEGPVGAYLLAGFFAGFTACNELPATCFAVFLGIVLARKSIWRTAFLFVPGLLVPAAAFLLTNYLALGRLTPAYSEVGGPWYDYAGSYWQHVPGLIHRGIDWASQRESRAVYAFHMLFGHHGFFALTPLFLLAAGAIVARLLRPRGMMASAIGMVQMLTLAVTVVVFGFYIWFAAARNYGGWTSGLRWLIWVTPLWMVSLLPAADWLARRGWGRAIAYAALGLSIVSVNYPVWTPWHHPWLYDLLEGQGWLKY